MYFAIAHHIKFTINQISQAPLIRTKAPCKKWLMILPSLLHSLNPMSSTQHRARVHLNPSPLPISPIPSNPSSAFEIDCQSSTKARLHNGLTSQFERTRHRRHHYYPNSLNEHPVPGRMSLEYLVVVDQFRLQKAGSAVPRLRHPSPVESGREGKMIGFGSRGFLVCYYCIVQGQKKKALLYWKNDFILVPRLQAETRRSFHPPYSVTTGGWGLQERDSEPGDQPGISYFHFLSLLLTTFGSWNGYQTLKIVRL